MAKGNTASKAGGAAASAKDWRPRSARISRGEPAAGEATDKATGESTDKAAGPSSAPQPARSVDDLMRSAATVAVAASLRDVRLVASTAKAAQPSRDAATTVEFAVHAALVRPDPAPDGFAVEVGIELAAHEGDDRREVLRLTAEFRLAFGHPDLAALDEQNLRDFAESSGLFSAWPYLREYVQSTTVRMGLPPIVIPTHRLGRSGTVTGRRE